MSIGRVFKALGPIDAQSVRRDSLLRWMIVFPVLIALLLRWGVPLFAAALAEQFQFDLSPYYPVVMSFVVLITPVLFGMIVGFLLLDERDDQTLTALQVTPMPLSSYLAYRVGLPMALSVVMTILIFSIAALVEIEVPSLLLAALIAAPLAPLLALFLAALAENKVQGFALVKASGITFLPPVIAYFIESAWQLAVGILPTYWPVKVFWLLYAGDPTFWLYALAGVAYQALLLTALLRRFNNVMHR